MHTLKIDQYSVDVYPGNPDTPLIYLHTDREEGEKIYAQLSGCCSLAVVYDTNWNRDFSPYPANKVFKKGEDFSGGAPEYLDVLTNRILPTVEASLPFPVCSRGVAGYSLAGLFSLYAGYYSPVFDRIASVSGSMWFDGWLDYALGNLPLNTESKIYLSLGDREHIGKNTRMIRVRECTDAVAGYLSKHFPTIYEINPGGHFNDGTGRTIKAIRTLCRM